MIPATTKTLQEASLYTPPIFVETVMTASPGVIPVTKPSSTVAIAGLLDFHVNFAVGSKPVYKVLPGWKQDIRGIKNYEELPENCRNYIEFIEKELEVPVTLVSNGPGRHEIIHRTK